MTVFIDKKDWFDKKYGRLLSHEHLLNQPNPDFHQSTFRERELMRQTECFINEVIQVLGTHQTFSLIRKYDATIGWLPTLSIQISDDIQSFEAHPILNTKPELFLKFWHGKKYILGGLTEDGIDCSGFTQRYFQEVHYRILPKNSWDQRKLGQSADFKDLKNHDLVFCRPFAELTSHHVAVFYEGLLWHSRRKGGVVNQTPEAFENDFKVEDVRRIL